MGWSPVRARHRVEAWASIGVPGIRRALTRGRPWLVCLCLLDRAHELPTEAACREIARAIDAA